MRDIFTDLAHEVQSGVMNALIRNYQSMSVGVCDTYLPTNMESGRLSCRAGHYHAIDHADSYDGEMLSRAIADILRAYIGDARRVLVVGFGNADYTCDALGASTLHAMDVTSIERDVALLAPRVERVTGLSSLEVVRGVMHEYEPDMLLAIDTLATSRLARLGTTIQITDAGLSPGGGVGRASCIVNSDSIGVPLVAIGVPLVISARALGRGHGTYLVPSTIDSIVERYSAIMARGITLALSDINATS